MNLADQSDGHGQRRQPIEAVVHGADVVDHLIDVPGDVAGQLGLGGEQVLQRTLRAFNLAGQHRFFADVHEDEQIGVGQGLNRPIKPSEHPVGLRQQHLQRPIEPYRRNRRQRFRQKCPIPTDLPNIPSRPPCRRLSTFHTPRYLSQARKPAACYRQP